MFILSCRWTWRSTENQWICIWSSGTMGKRSLCKRLRMIRSACFLFDLCGDTFYSCLNKDMIPKRPRDTRVYSQEASCRGDWTRGHTVLIWHPGQECLLSFLPKTYFRESWMQHLLTRPLWPKSARGLMSGKIPVAFLSTTHLHRFGSDAEFVEFAFSRWGTLFFSTVKSKLPKAAVFNLFLEKMIFFLGWNNKVTFLDTCYQYSTHMRQCADVTLNYQLPASMQKRVTGGLFSPQWCQIPIPGKMRRGGGLSVPLSLF